MTMQVDYNVKNLYKAIRDNNWDAAKAFIDEHDPSVLIEITPSRQTALHVAAQYGHVGIVNKLVSLVPPENLEIVDAFGFTPLATAANCGVSTQVAECLVNKNSDILGIPTPNMLLPVSYAFALGYKQMGRYLYYVTPLEVFKSQNGLLGSMLLRYCFFSRDLDIALDLLQRCKELIFATCTPLDKEDPWSPIMGIATMPFVFPSRSELVFWKRWIYNCIRRQSTTTTNDVRVDIQHESKSKRIQGLGLLHRFISKAYNFLGMKEIYEEKLMHAQAPQILSLACESASEITSFDRRAQLALTALLLAAREGNVEFVEALSKANPQLILLFSGQFGNAFFFAVKYRQAEVFNLIHGFRFKEAVATMVDESGNGLLHVAGMLAPSSQLNRISGAALQMQSELQWFKEVKSVVPLGLRVYENKEGMKPDEIFKESHKKLREEGEKWMKETSSSCSVVGALVVTIVFAAVFTIPGGNNQDFGYPNEKLFMLFLISDALSLFSSTTSVLMFLGILTSRYAEQDFLTSLPTKLIIGLSTLFLSIATMMIAFTTTIFIMLQHRPHSWVLFPAIMLASVPVTIFGLLQFPLLIRMVSSTYGRGIFKRNVKSWP